MKLRSVGALVALVAVALSTASAASAKSPPDKVVVSAPWLERPVEIVDPASLEHFHGWGRSFLAWERGIPAEALPTVENAAKVSLYLGSEQVEGPRLIYVLYYADGLIYLPGPHDPEWRLNIGTILSASTDWWDPNGRWAYATDEAGAVLNAAVSSADGESRDHPCSDGALGRQAQGGRDPATPAVQADCRA